MKAGIKNFRRRAAFGRDAATLAVQEPVALRIRAQLDTVAGTLHLCGNGPAKSNALPDKSGVPSATRQLCLSLCPVAPSRFWPRRLSLKWPRGRSKTGSAGREPPEYFRRAKQGDCLPIFAESAAVNHRKI
jgi:hypothetical protein